MYSLNCETYSHCANTAVTKGSDKLNLGHRRLAHLSHQNMLKLRNMSYGNDSDHSDSKIENSEGESNNQMQERRYLKRERKIREFPVILYQTVQTGNDELGEPAVFNEAMKAAEERHSKELQRARDMHAATAKLHRKRSCDSKT
jgi:hypothetical protein